MKSKILSVILVMVLFITSYMPASVVRASEIDNVDSCAMDYLENKEIINNDVKIKTFYPGGSVSAALTVNGDLYCWGKNDCGQVGNGVTVYQYTPVKVLENVKDFYSNYNAISAAITTNGDLYCWGYNWHGQVGNGSTVSQHTPVKVLENVKEFYSDSFTSSAVTTNGDLYCWGDNTGGAVGNGSTEHQYTPVKVLENVKEFYSDDSTSAAVTTNGDLYCWGENTNGVVGNGSTDDQYTPVKVLENVKEFYGSRSTPSVVTTNGDLYCWGNNYYGAVGNGSTDAHQYTPVKVLENVKEFYSAGFTSSAITTNGDLYCWGENSCGQVGNGSTDDQYTPVKVLENVKKFYFHYDNSVRTSTAITTNGDLYCWGVNYDGQVGNGSTAYQHTPVKVLENVKDFYGDGSTSSAATTNGDLYCWGNNYDGQVGNGSTDAQYTPVKVLENVKEFYVNGFTSSAVTTNGDLYCWGDNGHGQVGNGSIDDQYTPNKILENVKEFYIVNVNDCWNSAAVTTNGDLYCWGDNYYGEVGNGSTENQLTPYKVTFPADENNDSITELTQIKCDVRQYGAPTYVNTSTGDIYDDTDAFIRAMNNYLMALKTACDTDAKAIKKNKSTKAKMLKDRDAASKDKIITMDSNISDTALDSVYEALAQYLDMYVDEGKTLGKIDTSASLVQVSASIVNEIRNNLDGLNFERTINGYTVKFSVTHFLGAYFGSVSVSKGLNESYTGTIISSAKGTAKVLNEYINTLSDWTEDALYSCLNSVVGEFAQVTCISGFTYNEISEVFSDKVATLQSRGYGNTLKNFQKMKDGYDLVSDIVTAKKSKKLSDVMQNADTIYKKLKKIDYSDKSVSNSIVKTAMDKLVKAKETLQTDFENYLYKGDAGKKSWITEKWQNFQKLFVQCPVDVEIDDENGNVLGSTNGTEYTYKDDIYIDVDGDVKTIIIPSDLKVKLKFTGTDDGTMNYVIEQNVDGNPVGRLNYYDIPLKTDKEYTQSLDGDDITADSNDAVISKDSTITPSEYLSVSDDANITVESAETDGGTVVGTGIYPLGDPVSLTAYPENGYKFAGWYMDGELRDLSSVYRFTARENVDIEAKFVKDTVRDTSAVVKIADSYKASTNFIVYKNEDGTDNILISMIGESKIDKLNVSLKKHTNSSIDEKNLSISADEDNRFMIDAENVDNVSSIDIYNTDNNQLIGTVEFSNEQQPSLYGHSISLKNNGLIAVNSYWKMTDDFVKNSGAYVVMSINSSVSNALSKNDKKIYVKDAVNKNGYINFIYDLAPAQIGQTVTTDLFSSNGKLISSSSYSIKDYCYDYLDAYKAGENETEKNLVISLLNYGAYAQKYFKYETMDFVNKNLTDNEKNVPEIQNSKAFIEQYGKNSIVNSNGIEYIGTSLLLESGCVIRHYFKIDNSKTGNLSCYVNKGTSSERKLDLKKKGTYYYVDIDSIPAYSLKKDFKVTIYNGKDSSKKTIIDYSVYNYIAKALSKNDNSTLSELMKSLYWYGQYANEIYSK